MGLLESLAELIAPTRCAGCDLPGGLLCEACLQVAMRFIAEESCPRCGAPFGALTCTECWETQFGFEAAVALGEMGHPLARAVVLHKDGGERRLAGHLGGLLGERCARQWPGWAEVVVPIPGKREAIARRGFDHAAALAAPVAERLCAPTVEALAWTKQGVDQRRLGRAGRAANLADAFSAITACDSRVLLVDDVMTTGATLDAAASALLEGGATAVRVAVIARAW